MSGLDAFLLSLTHQKNTLTVTNPYLDDGVVNNLRLYLEYMLNIQGKCILLVGEAPGYKGCRVTGIPFTSGRIFESVSHPLLTALKDQLSLNAISAENTATIVWQYLATRKTIPLFWNSYPFHPHPKGNDQKNRAPNKKEIMFGVSYLQSLYDVFKPETIAGIGTKGLACASKAFPELPIEYIRHPSYGGKAEFIEGMDNILQ